jgi:hypothetical protein
MDTIARHHTGQEADLKRTIGLLALVAAFAAISAVPASAGQKNVVKGAVYKGEYFSMGVEYPVRVKTYKSGKGGNFSLKCAGIQREKIDIAKGKFKIELGADEVMVKGRGHFKPNDEFAGAITKVITPGATCMGGGDFEGIVVDS